MFGNIVAYVQLLFKLFPYVLLPIYNGFVLWLNKQIYYFIAVQLFY